MLRYVASWGLALLLSLILPMLLLPRAPAIAAVNGQCGLANGAVTNVSPSANLCNAGTASDVTGNGPWIWSCAGSGGGTMASCATAAASSCPKGQTYISAGDGCVNAQATGSVQRANYFTGFINGITYPVRPPWNVAGVDYAVGYSGTLKDPAVSGNLPACVSSYNANTLIANADKQPCVLDHLDFTLHGGYCFLVTGTGGNTVTFSNDHFAAGTSNCPQSSGWINMRAGNTANVMVKYSEFDDNYGCNCAGAISMNGTGAIVVAYTAALGITGRLENTSSSAAGSILNEYDYIEGIGNGYEHGEIVEINSANPYVYNELWNNYYAKSTNCCDTALLYLQSAAPGPQGPGMMTSSKAIYNVLIARSNTRQTGGVTVSAPIWVDTSFDNTIGTLTVANNYVDSLGSYYPIHVNYLANSTGSLGSSMCSGNVSLLTGTLTDGIIVTAGKDITGTLGSGKSALVCH